MYSEFELVMMVCAPFILFGVLSLGYWLVLKLIDMTKVYRAYQRYKKENDYWYDFDATPEEFFKERGI